MTPCSPLIFAGLSLGPIEAPAPLLMPELPEIPMSCKPESQKQRLERIAVQLMAGQEGNPHEAAVGMSREQAVKAAIDSARELIKQLDALPLDE